MKKNDNIKNLLKGTTQGKQVPAALDPKHFSVDERDQMQLLSYCAQIASSLNYYSPEGKKDGSWESFLLADESVLTSRISQYNGSGNLDQMIQLANAIEAGGLPSEQNEFAQRFFQSGFDAILQINAWYKLSGQSFSNSGMTSFLKSKISTTGRELLNEFYGLYFVLCETIPAFINRILPSFSTLDLSWAFNPFPEFSPRIHPTVQRVVAQAAPAGQQLFSWLDEIAGEAKDAFRRSKLRNDIPPHIGLLLTFLDIFRHEQDVINSLTERHLDFYFKQLLKCDKRSAVPDTAILAIELLKTDQLLIPKGTRFDGGKNAEGIPVTLCTLRDQAVTATEISQYRTLTFPASATSPAGIEIGTIDKFNQIGNDTWPLFGNQIPNDRITVAKATIGFAFSCSDLLMSQSTRQVTITFATENNVQELKKNLDDAFCFSLTSSAGWFSPERISVVYNFDLGTLSAVISFKPGDPAIVRYAEKLHGKGFETPWPVCQVTLTETGSSQYAQLRQLNITSVAISVDVTGATNFLVENDTGKLNANAPFNPFNIQSVASSLYIGGQELFVKPLTDLTINITWDSLPRSFLQYYSAYNDYYKAHSGITEITKQPAFLNQAFAANVFTLNEGEWVPAAGKSSAGNYLTRYELFTDEGPSLLLEKRIVDKKSIRLQGVLNKSIHPFPYDPMLPSFTGTSNTLQQGFICLTLCSPDKGFGYADYPIVVADVTLKNSEAIMHNAQLVVFKKKKILPMPNIPYAPRIKSVEIDYHSEGKHKLDSHASPTMKWYHIHPAGIKPVSLVTSSAPLFPQYACTSYIYFGMKTLIPNTDLSFYFVLDNPVKSITSQNAVTTVYEYLSDEGWAPLEVMSDSTDGLQRTGIVCFAVPANALCEADETLADLYWFRLGQEKPGSVSVGFISTQAIEVNRDINDDKKIVPLPAGTITKLTDALTGIKSIVQPAASFGAMASQTDAEFGRATAGRLRDKGRVATLSAIAPSVLDKFPDLYSVAAIPLGYGDRSCAGSIKVVVTPFTNLGVANCYTPMASTDAMEAVLDHLTSIGLPGVQYQISNPDFFPVTVTCHVAFSTSGQDDLLEKRLNEDIQNFLSPWIKDNPVKETFLASGLQGQLYSLVKSLPYILRVQDLTCTPLPPIFSCETLIVSAPQHSINKINASTPALPKADDGLRIGKNFLITQ